MRAYPGYDSDSLKPMDAPAIIPTRHRKSKVPKTHTYPAGAKIISEALAGVPQFDQLTIDFRYVNSMARFHECSTQYQVLEAAYSGPGPRRFISKAMDEAGYNRPKWEIRVDAVPCSLRHTIQAKLVAAALPAVRAWLMANPHSNEREGFHALKFVYDELEEELKSDERSTIEWRTSRA